MTIAGRREARFSDITKVRNLGTKFYAMSGKRQTVLVAQNTGGLADLVGETASLGVEARDIATNSPTSDTLYILTATGMRIATLANTPVLGAAVSFDPGDGRWILSTANAGTPYIVTPVDSGIQVLDQAGVRTSVSTPAGVAGCRDAVLGSDDVLYAVDEQRAKIHVWRITASKAVYIDSFRAKNCRDVIRMALDSTANILFVQCKHRIVGFNVTAAGTENSAISVTLRQDYGGLKANYTDFAKIGTNKYWIGVDADSALNAAPQFYGRTYAAWDTTNQVLFTAFPDMSIFAASNVIPYVGEIQIPPVPGIPDIPVIVVPPVVPLIFPPAVTPAAPVITSSLTASVMEDSVFNYVIAATGTGPITYSVTSPPAWLTGINPVTGTLSGIPPDPGTVNVTIRATNAGGSDTRTLVVTITNAIGDLSAVTVNGQIFSVAVYSNLVYILGIFTGVTDSSGALTRNYSACLNVSTGLWTSWNPTFSGPVDTDKIYVDATGTYVYVTNVTTINGSASNYLRRVGAVSGITDSGWTPSGINSTIYGLVIVGSSVYVTGSMTTPFMGGAVFALLNGATVGAVSGAITNNSGGSCVHDGTKLWHGINYLPASAASGYASTGQMASGLNFIAAERFLGMAHNAGVILGVGDFINRQAVSLPSGVSLGSNRTYAAMWSAANGTIQAATALDGVAVLFECAAHPISGFLACGSFALSGGLAAYRGVVRLDSSGAVVTSFALTWSQPAPDVRSIATVLGAVVFVGSFTGTINGVSRARLAVANAATGVLY